MNLKKIKLFPNVWNREAIFYLIKYKTMRTNPKSIVIYLLFLFLFHLPSWAYKIESSSFPYTLYRLGLWKHTTKSLDFYQINLQVLIFTICFYFSTACYSLFWMLNSLYLVTVKIALSFNFLKDPLHTVSSLQVLMDGDFLKWF